MRKLVFVVVLLFYLDVALSVRFYTEVNDLCVTECAQNGESYHWCYTDGGWGFCSTQANVDYRGRACRNDHPCSKHDAIDYSWCYVDSVDNWGYCGTHGENLKVIASNGYYCTNECRQSESPNGKYYWCNTTMMGWDYCSPKEGLDYSGKECRPDHFCDKHGQDFYWCYVDSENNWGYCSIEGESKHLTERGYYCTTECEMNGENYFWCRHNEGWGYCSLTENSDSHGRACRADHDCGKHDGTSYTWCKRNEENEWDYCGQISADDLLETTSPDAMLQQTVIDSVVDETNCILTEWIFSENKGINKNVFKRYINAAKELVLKWNVQEIPRYAGRSKYYKNKDVRIDMEGTYGPDNLRFANIQIQMNIKRKSGKSTTIANVLLQAGVNFPVEYIQKALLLSLDMQGVITLQKRTYAKDKKPKCKWPKKYGGSKKYPPKRTKGG